MLFHVEMQVNLPHDLDPERAAALKLDERERAQALQRSGQWRHLWRLSGQYANISVFDVADAEELHQLLSSLPLFPFMRIEVRPMNRHPSSIHADDR
ncbi:MULTISPECIES: muconolactone Delta-isomerase [Chromobacterium]|uniref:muconolactone Delta-isomerase n=1 Tax=Chromobacterium TaxID=535 RepID=UPI0005BD21DA|nr:MULTISPECIES: muconolactone Delta-isomerase [Chromobacterium]QOZ84217.1 muconolactone Delta-isomerase [Chromobacterium sp. Rain0013]UGA37700.1 muconolactone Delta-isomerase [Chromobacterium haemolyticum]WON84380.1 muconolactone Delta-isomerase [Chromobacterium haemolyticum]